MQLYSRVPVTIWLEILFALHNSKSTQIIADYKNVTELVQLWIISSKLSVVFSEASQNEKAAKENMPYFRDAT